MTTVGRGGYATDADHLFRTTDIGLGRLTCMHADINLELSVEKDDAFNLYTLFSIVQIKAFFLFYFYYSISCVLFDIFCAQLKQKTTGHQITCTI